MYHYISIHALLAESDAISITKNNKRPNFYPRSPCGERPLAPRERSKTQKDFYPRSPCGERPTVKCTLAQKSLNFYPRSPCGERPKQSLLRSYFCQFLSTLSLRRATRKGVETMVEQAISIHALLAESDVGQKRFRQKLAISIHALLAESDSRTKTVSAEVGDFYPRSPCGERQ